MPLPAFTPGGRRTSTYGGTMLGLHEKQRANFEKAFELGLMLYFDVKTRIEQFKETNILPPIRDAWKSPVLAEPNDVLVRPAARKAFAELADQTPAQYTEPLYATCEK